jgi:very-short-patch-repair endonuclease
MKTSGVVKRQRIANTKLVIARDFRKEMTESEELLWQKLRRCQLGVKIRRQQIIEGFIVDFFCETAKLVIEVDGAVHDNEDQKKADQHRRLVFEERGLQEIRFTNEQVKFSINSVVDEIRNIVLQRL